MPDFFKTIPMTTFIQNTDIPNYSTPFYYYNLNLLEKTLKTAQQEAKKHNFHIHYALKANNNPEILSMIQSFGIGADCVSGNEITTAIAHDFPANKIFFAGVGKTDKEIQTAIKNNIFCFNVESLQELEVLNNWAQEFQINIRVALRINPNIDAKTHKFISTGKAENKFGIPDEKIDQAIEIIENSSSINLIGLHFHIGSQILDLEIYKILCETANYWNNYFLQKNHKLKILNLGGGLGIDYQNPEKNSIPDFKAFFQVFAQHLKTLPQQEVHFELGRSLVGQCGNLITKVLYIKEGLQKNFAIIDAGMTDLIRPALYQAQHKIKILTPKKTTDKINYEIVGPICESADSFSQSTHLPKLKRGDYLMINSVGAYGEVMASQYNMRDKIKAFTSCSKH